MGDDKKKSRSKSVSRKFKSRNPFINFLQDFLKTYRSHEHNKPTKQLFKLAGERWKQMTEEEKAPYINAAREVEKPKHKPFKKKKVVSKKKSRKRTICCSRCGHRHGSPVSHSANDSVESIWTIKPVDRDSRNSGTTSSRTRSRSRNVTETTVTDDDYTEESTTYTSY